MSKIEIPVKDLPTHIARAVVIAPDIHPKTNQVYTHEVIFTHRPGFSNLNKYAPALPGGKIDHFTDFEFDGGLTPQEFNNPLFMITLSQMIEAGMYAAVRELSEELSLLLAPALLQFVDVSTNTSVHPTTKEKIKWTNYTYVAQLDRKPLLMVKPNSAGTIWVSEDDLINHRPRLLPGHLGMARRAIKHVEKKDQS
jgi:8-oxo-dGTP pyrophosphatase MutT (NUDIX family)